MKDNKFKNKKQPELIENQTAYKSDNQGVKKETFVQTGRRGGDGQPEWRRLAERRWLAERVVPHLHVDKPGGTTGSQTNPATQGSSVGK